MFFFLLKKPSLSHFSQQFPEAKHTNSTIQTAHKKERSKYKNTENTQTRALKDHYQQIPADSSSVEETLDREREREEENGELKGRDRRSLNVVCFREREKRERVLGASIGRHVPCTETSEQKQGSFTVSTWHPLTGLFGGEDAHVNYCDVRGKCDLFC